MSGLGRAVKSLWIWIALAIVAFGAVLALLGTDPEPPVPWSPANDSTVENRPASEDVEALNETSPPPPVSEPDLALWEVADPDSVTYEASSVRRNAVTERYAMRYEADVLRALEVESVVSVPMPDGIAHGEARVVQRVEHANGDVSVVANMDDSLGAGFLVMTVGDSNVHMTLHGAMGAYELSGDTRSGWLVPSARIGPIGPEGYDDVLEVEPATRSFPAPGAPQGANP